MDLNTILIIVGIMALVALIVHGLWSNRREKSKYFDKANKFDRTSPTSRSHTQEEMVQPNNISLCFVCGYVCLRNFSADYRSRNCHQLLD